MRWLLYAVLALQLVIGLAHALATPLWIGHEQDFYAVIRFTVDNGRLPTPDDYPDGDADIRQATQPPLYFLSGYSLVALFDDGQPAPPDRYPALVCLGGDASVQTLIGYPTTASYDWPPSGTPAAAFGLRVLNVIYGVVSVIFTYWAGRALFPRWPMIALVGAALLAFEPATMRLNSLIGNEPLSVAIGAANLWACARLIRVPGIRWREVLLVLVTAALALLTRLTGWSVFALSALALLAVVGRTLWHSRTRGQVRAALLALSLIVVAALAVGLFNLSQYGSVFGRYSQLDAFALRILREFNLSPTTLITLLDHTRMSYLEPLLALEPRALLTQAYSAMILVALVGALWLLVRSLYSRESQPTAAILLLGASVVIMVVFVVLRNAINADLSNTTLYNTGFVYAPLRYYAVALPALALLISAGLLALIPRLSALDSVRALHPLGAGVALVWLIVSVLTAAVLIGARPQAAVMTRAEFDALTDVERFDASSGGQLPQVLGYRAQPAVGEGMIDLTLYLGASGPLTSDYGVRVELAQRGSPLGFCEFVPGQGALPTSRWSAEQVIVSRQSIPNCAPTSADAIDLSLRWLDLDAEGERPPMSGAAALGSIDGGLAVAATCPQHIGIVNQGYLLLSFNSPVEVPTGELYLPSVNWFVLDAEAGAVQRVFTFTHVDSGDEYTCEGTPAPAAYDPAGWLRGQTIYFDVCRMTFPEDAPRGSYAVSVGLQDAAGALLSGVDQNGQPFEAGRIPVGEITLTD